MTATPTPDRIDERSSSGSTFEVTAEDAFDFRSADYAELFAASAATAFQHPIWLAQLYEKVVRQSAAAPLIIVVRVRESGKLAMVLPLVRRRYMLLRAVEFADMRVSDYASPVAEPETFSRILADSRTLAAIRRQLRPYDILRIGKLSDQALPMQRLFGLETRNSMEMNAYCAKLEPTFADWRARQLDQSYRRELDKKWRQLNRMGEARFDRMMGASDIRMAFDALKLYRGRRFDGSDGPVDLLQQKLYFDFYLAVANEGCGGFARTFVFFMNGKPVASALGLKHRETLLVILSGFDETSYRKQSIGSLLFEQIARDCIEQGDLYLDFTIGDEPYKRIFGGRPSPMWQFHKSGSPFGYAAHMAVEKLPALKDVARRILTATPGGKLKPSTFALPVSDETASRPEG